MDTVELKDVARLSYPSCLVPGRYDILAAMEGFLSPESRLLGGNELCDRDSPLPERAACLSVRPGSPLGLPFVSALYACALAAVEVDDEVCDEYCAAMGRKSFCSKRPRDGCTESVGESLRDRVCIGSIKSREGDTADGRNKARQNVSFNLISS